MEEFENTPFCECKQGLQDCFWVYAKFVPFSNLVQLGAVGFTHYTLIFMR